MPDPTRSAALRSASRSMPPGSPPELSLKPPVARVAARKTALGLVCTRSFPAVVNIADMMLKSSGVTLVGYEKTGDGYCTAVVRGNYADVKIAVATGVDIAKQFEQYVSSMMLPRPLPNLDAVLPITEEFAEYVERAGDFEATGAIGLIETTGFPAMVGASDAAMKCANVELITYETTGAGLCTAVLQGPIADVTMAIEAGMAEAERIGDLHAVAVIPRPLDDLMKVMPKPQHWLAAPEAPQPLELPDPETVPETVRERELQPLSLPELEPVPVELRAHKHLKTSEALEIPRDTVSRDAVSREEIFRKETFREEIFREEPPQRHPKYLEEQTYRATDDDAPHESSTIEEIQNTPLETAQARSDQPQETLPRPERELLRLEAAETDDPELNS